jgi:hypothetical protein
MNILLFAALALLVLIFLKVKLSKGSSAGAPRAPKANRTSSARQSGHARSPYAAVSIQCPDDACQPVRALDGQRFLEMEAPITPLSDCTSTKCQCRYRHHADRRSAEDRRDPLRPGGPPVGFHGSLERRSNSERRKEPPGEHQKDVGYRELLRAAAQEEVRGQQA